jgi:hypothetical protein
VLNRQDACENSRHSKVAHPMTFARISIIILVVAMLLVIGVAYDRGKKCGAWEAVYAGSKGSQAQRAKPIGCWRLH